MKTLMTLIALFVTSIGTVNAQINCGQYLEKPTYDTFEKKTTLRTKFLTKGLLSPMNPIILSRVTTKTDTVYFASFRAVSSTSSYSGHGLKIMFMDNTIHSEDRVEVDYTYEYSKYGSYYNVKSFLIVNEELLELLKTKPIKVFRLYTDDRELKESERNNFLNAVKCLVVTN